MVPSSFDPPEGYRPVYQQVARGIYEVVNATEDTYRYFDRPSRNGQSSSSLHAPIVQRRAGEQAADSRLQRDRESSP